MAVNRVEYGGQTLIDISGSTVTPETLAAGAIAYNAAGERIIGTANLGTALNYSTSEQNTGVRWIDGKPVYRIVVEIPAIPASHSSTDGVAHLPENIETIISINGALNRGGNVYTLDFETNSTSVYKADFWINIAERRICIRTNSSTPITGGYVIVEYTKTTDSIPNRLDYDALDALTLA